MAVPFKVFICVGSSVGFGFSAVNRAVFLPRLVVDEAAISRVAAGPLAFYPWFVFGFSVKHVCYRMAPCRSVWFFFRMRYGFGFVRSHVAEKGLTSLRGYGRRLGFGSADGNVGGSQGPSSCVAYFCRSP